MEYVEAQYAHLPHLSDHLREPDRIELEASANPHTLKAMVESVSQSDEAFTVMEDGAPIAVGGMATYQRDESTLEGVPWLLGTNRVYEHPVSLIRAASRFMASFDAVDYFIQAVWSYNHASIRYLKALGFEPMVTTAMGGRDFTIYMKSNV